MHSIKEAIIAKEHEPETESYIFYMDLRTVGKGFEEYKVRGAKVSGLKYVRGRVAEILQDEELNPVVYYEDTEQRKVVSMTLDMVILANACSAPRGIAEARGASRPGTGREQLCQDASQQAVGYQRSRNFHLRMCAGAS